MSEKEWPQVTWAARRTTAVGFLVAQGMQARGAKAGRNRRIRCVEPALVISERGRQEGMP